MQLHADLLDKAFERAEEAWRAAADSQRREALKNERRAAFLAGGKKKGDIGALHDRDIVQQQPDSEPKNPPERPVLLIMAGGPGSGKTTLSSWMKKKRIFDGPFITMTLGFFEGLPEFKKIAEDTKHPHPEKSPTLVDEYYYLRKEYLKESIKRGYSLVVDDHMDNPQADKELIDMANKAGYLTVMVGMTIPPYPYFYDVKKLIETKGIDHTHTPWALEKHAQFAERWESLARMCDYAFLYQKYNSYQNPIALLAEYDNMSYRNAVVEIKDPERYARFKDWANVNKSATEHTDAFPRGEAETLDDYEKRMGRDTGGSRKGRGSDTKPVPSREGTKEFAQRLKDVSETTIITGLS